MIVKATITLTELQLREILVEYLQKEGIGFVSHQDISFNIEYVKKSADKDSCGTYEFTGVTVRNLKVGTPSGMRD